MWHGGGVAGALNVLDDHPWRMLIRLRSGIGSIELPFWASGICFAIDIIHTREKNTTWAFLPQEHQPFSCIQGSET